MTVSAILTPAGLTVAFDSGPLMIKRNDANFQSAISAWKCGDVQGLQDLMSPKKSIVKFSESNLEFLENGEVTYQGQVIQNYAIGKILEMQSQALPWRMLAKFLDRLMANPSHRSVSELYKFLETENLPITDDGHFLAYKRVKDDWTDFHTGKISNKIGETVVEPRNAVDDDPAHGCSKGLHAGALSYVANFHSGGHLIIVKIDPADVVSVPNEDVRKLRCCKYVVIKEMDSALVESAVYGGITAKPIFTAEVIEDDDLEEDFEEDGENSFQFSELIAIAEQIVGMKIAIDRPLGRLMNGDQLETFESVLSLDYEFEINDLLEPGDLAELSLEGLYEEICK